MSELNTTGSYGDGDVIPLWRTTVEQTQFSSWTNGLAASGGTQAGDNFSGFSVRHPVEEPAVAATADADIFSVAYKKGWEDGQAALQDENASSTAENDTLAVAIAQVNDLASPDSFAFILTAVEALFRRCSELAVPDPALLQAWAKQLAELVDQDQKGATLVLHPEDVALIDSDMCKLALRGDASMMRGNVKLSHAGGWIEKGSEVVLDELRTLIDEFSGATGGAGHD